MGGRQKDPRALAAEEPMADQEHELLTKRVADFEVSDLKHQPRVRLGARNRAQQPAQPDL